MVALNYLNKKKQNVMEFYKQNNLIYQINWLVFYGKGHNVQRLFHSESIFIKLDCGSWLHYNPQLSYFFIFLMNKQESII